MEQTEAVMEYNRALKMGQKSFKELSQKNKNPYPAVLDEILNETDTDAVLDIGLVEIPAELIVGTKTAGRVTAFTADFLPLLGAETEFAYKWINLCAAHLSDEGIREPIVCYEYMGKFYVQEGNKRVSVLRYFGAPRIPGMVMRIMPRRSDAPEVAAYYEFLDFYKSAGIYAIQFRQPGDYAKLLSYLGKDPGEQWTEREQKTFRAYYHYFREAFSEVGGEKLDLLPEEALLLWLQVYPFLQLGEFSGQELKKTMQSLWPDMVSISQIQPVQVETAPETEGKSGILSMLLPSLPEHLNVAFIHQMDPATSTWSQGHEEGAQHMQQMLGNKVTMRSYYHADTPEQTDELIDLAVAEGAQVVFTTTPKLSRSTLRASVKYPKVKFLNCSVAAPYSSVRTYYSRIFEGKFITGAIAGAMADNDRIGYIGSYPIFGVPASINAFALGAQLTNPRAKIELRWSCLPGTPAEDFAKSGIQVVSNRDIPVAAGKFREFGGYGTYFIDEKGNQTPLGSPCWKWGKFYEHVVSGILNGAWDRNKESHQAVNYWWGMDSGVIDVELSDALPEGLRIMADMLRKGLQKRTIDPFRRKIVAQDGTIINTGNRTLSPEELLRMDWLCENVEGYLPPFDQIQSFARDMVRELGVYRDEIPLEKEGSL